MCLYHPPMSVSRRRAIQSLAMAGAGVGLAPVIIRGQSSPIVVAGKPVEISVATVSRSTVRISVRPIVNGKPQAIVNRGALVDAAEQQVSSGDLLVRVIDGASPTIGDYPRTAVRCRR